MREQLTLDWETAPAPPYPMTTQLRPYQAETVAACLASLTMGHHPVLSLPTGAGKSIIIAALCDQLEGRILVATHRQELLEQDAAQLLRYATGTAEEYGLYSAGLARRDENARILFGGIQSIYHRMDRLQLSGSFAYIIVDECHRCPISSVPSMYRAVFEACPEAQRIGLTATPYRLDSGLLHEGDAPWFDAMPVHLGIRALTPDYLSPLVGVLTAHDIDVSQVRTRAGDFVSRDLSQAACEESVVQGALDELCTLAAHRKKWLLFCVDVTHTFLVTRALCAKGITTQCVTGDTPQDERRATLDRFRHGEIRALVNCEVLTTGFDVADVDCIAMLRPTQSKALVVQCLGRGTRQAAEKSNCVVLDFAGNIERHTPLDELFRLTKSPARQAIDEEQERQDAAARERLVKHRQQASLADPMGRVIDTTPKTYRVDRVTYRIQAAKKAPHQQMLLVSYICPERIGRHNITIFLCVEHQGWAREQATAWFSRRGMGTPPTARDSLRTAWQLENPTHIVVKEDASFPRVLMEHFAIEPESREGQNRDGHNDPFALAW